MGVYEEIGVKRAINAAFCLTILGGNTLAKETLEAAAEADRHFVDMRELCPKVGEIIASITESEAACVTTGAFCGMVLSTAACMAGKDLDKMRKLPDTTGMKNEVIIQRNMRYNFDRAIEIPGGKFVVVEPNIEAMETAITEKTAAIHYLASLHASATYVIPLQDVIDLGHKHGIPIIVDAAGQTYPIDSLKVFAGMGADLVCYSGKYFSGPNSTGFIAGKKEYVEAAAANSFLGPFVGWIGRASKIDRQEVIALLVALQRWVKMDHEKERFQPAREKRDQIIESLKSVPDIKLIAQPYSAHTIGLQITLEKKTPEETAELDKKLKEGDPAIHIRSFKENNLFINTLFLADGDEYLLAQRLKDLII